MNQRDTLSVFVAYIQDGASAYFRRIKYKSCDVFGRMLAWESERWRSLV